MIHPIKRSTPIQTHPLGNPVTVSAAADSFADGGIVGYINGNTLAMLSRLAPETPHGPGCKCRPTRNNYGFIYLLRPRSGPTFIQASATAAITAAQIHKDGGNREFFLCNSTRELLDLFANHHDVTKSPD